MYGILVVVLIGVVAVTWGTAAPLRGRWGVPYRSYRCSFFV